MKNLTSLAILCLLGCLWLPVYAAKYSAHHDFPDTVSKFHDVLAPLWHSPYNEQRSQKTCEKSSVLGIAADKILKAKAPKITTAKQWTTAVENLQKSLATLSISCAKKPHDASLIESSFSEVHDKFHGLVKLIGHKHPKAPPLTGALSVEEETDYLIISEAFAECAALQNTLADIASENEDEYKNHMLHHSASDAITIATDFSLLAGQSKEHVQFNYQHHISRFISMLEKSTDGYQRFAVEVRPIIKKCAALNTIQTGLITERRKQNYSVE